MNLLDIKIDAIECTAAGEAYIVIKAIRDAYAWAHHKATEDGVDSGSLPEYSAERVAYFNDRLVEAEALMQEEAEVFGDGT